MKNLKIKAYKVFNPDWTCKYFQYKVGETYEIKEYPILCKRGFHACKKIQDCFNYYSFNPKNKVAEVLLEGIVLGLDEDKQCSNKITIVKELSWIEMLELANTGIGNSGNRNSGYSNSGDWNSGDWNSGNSNSGNRNSGYRNSGYRNSGYRNSGYSNSGNSNSGNWNSGNSNSGNWNSGDWNACDRNNGYFNTISPDEIMVFNKPCKKELWDNVEKPDFIYNIILNKWIWFDDMNDEEKKQYPKAYVCNGHLKTFSYKEAWKNAFDESEVDVLKSLPNFDPEVFRDITGIHV